MSRAGRRAAEPRDEAHVMLAQAAGEEGLGMAYLYGYDDEWQVAIRVEKILPAASGVAYPRCTGGRGEDIPGEGYRGIWEFNAERAPAALDIYFDPEDLTDDLAGVATVIVPGS
jgi:Plasmid pRiA4b ORF-3-like protein